MKVGLFHAEGVLYELMFGELSAKLMLRDKVTLNKPCLCALETVQDYNCVIVHPHYDNQDGCWDKIKDLAVNNPEVNFYVMALGTSERNTFFASQLENLILIDERNQSDFFSNPHDYLEK